MVPILIPIDSFCVDPNFDPNAFNCDPNFDSVSPLVFLMCDPHAVANLVPNFDPEFISQV